MLMIITPFNMSRIVVGGRRMGIVGGRRRSIVGSRRRSIIACSRMVGGRRGMMAGRLKVWGRRLIRLIDMRIRSS